MPPSFSIAYLISFDKLHKLVHMGQSPLVALRRGRNPLLFKKTEQGVRNATAFRGEANKTASPTMAVVQTHPQKRSGGTFLTEQALYGSVQSIKMRIFR